jgi:hypothetical protein
MTRSLVPALLAVLASAFLLGCTTYPEERHVLQKLEIICIPKDEINTTYWANVRGSEVPETYVVKGWSEPWLGRVYVPWSGGVDRFGRPVPDLEVLGHEVWHLAGEWYHDDGGAR